MGQSPPSTTYNDIGVGLPFLQGCAEFGAKYPAPDGYCSAPTRECDVGDILLSVRAPVGRINVADRRYGIGRGLAAITPTRLNGQFLEYALHAAGDWLRSMSTGSTYDAVSAADVGNVLIPVPPDNDAGRIVSYLDRIMAKVDQAIAAKKRLLELLLEERRAVATELVAADHLIGPLGFEIPEVVRPGWEYLRLKRLLRESRSRSTTGTEQLLSLRMNAGLVQTDSVLGRRVEARHLVGYKLVDAGELVMNRMRASIGLFGVARVPGLVSSDYAVYEVNGRIDGDYLLAVLTLPQFGAAIRANSTGMGTGSSGFMRVYSDDLGKLVVPVPPIEEQQAIVANLNQASDKSLAARTTAQRQIELLEEYRTVLIADAVTGELDLSSAGSSQADTIAEEAVEVAAAGQAP